LTRTFLTALRLSIERRKKMPVFSQQLQNWCELFVALLQLRSKV
jgi:hypothetical protein